MNTPLTPEAIRSIRRKLGLTQAQAGQLIGGGPRAFAKYESGTVRPAASVVTLMRLLEANPQMMDTLVGRRTRPMPPTEVGPFEVVPEHVAALDAQSLPHLLDRLLRSEAQANALPNPDIHIPFNINARDGGEDGRITWEGGPGRSEFLPSRICQFQLKAREIRPTLVGAEVLRRGTVKRMVRSALEAGGCYLMLSSRAYSRESIENREARLRDAVRGAGLDVRNVQIVFRDATWIADWTNRHPSVATWLKESTQPGTLGPFRSWSHWSERSEHDLSPFVDDERLPPYRAFLRERAATPRSVARVVGLAGIGKSRLTLEALAPSDDDQATALSPSDLLLYAVESEVGSEAIVKTVEVLATGGQRTIVVVDSCPPETHRILQGTVLRSESRLSLVTLDDEIPSGTPDRHTYKLKEAPTSVTNSIIHRLSPHLPSEDRRRLEHFSKGFPKVAMLVGQAWADDRPVAHATDEDLVNVFVLGRSPRDSKPLLRSAELLATFGLIGIDHQDRRQLAEVAVRGQDISAADLYAHIQDLVARGVAQRRGGSVILQPPPIAMKLAERQWCRWEWDRDQWDDVLAGQGSSDLKIFAARRLKSINTTPIAREVVTHVCRHRGPFDGSQGVSVPGNARVLSYLAQIEHDVVAALIERSLDDFGDPSEISGQVLGDLVAALEWIAFHPDGFESGARLLLRLSVARGNEYLGNAQNHFQTLFPVLLGNTAADGVARLLFLTEFADTDDLSERLVLVEALAAGSTMGRQFSRTVGAETHGSRPAMESWQPATADQRSDYLTGCVELLVRFAMGEDEAGVKARYSLGERLRGLVGSGFIDIVENAVRRVGSVAKPWPEALEALSHFLIIDSDSIDGDTADRVQALIRELTPQDLESRVRLLVTEMPWDYLDDGSEDFDARTDRQIEAVRSLAAGLIRAPEVLARVLPEISRGSQRMAHVLGRALAELDDNPLTWFDPLVSAVLEAPEEERNFDLLSGFLSSLACVDPDPVEAFKREAAGSSELAPALPLICYRIGISPGDIDLSIQALADGFLPAWHLEQWTIGGCLTDTPSRSVGRLVDALLSHGDKGFDVAVILMHMYAHRTPGRLEELRPQLCRVAEEFTRWECGVRYFHAENHFIRLMKWILAMGRDDDDASAAALTLAKAAVVSADHSRERCLKELMPLLLESFPEIVWPLISQEIVSEEGYPWRREYLLGERPSRGGGTTPTILSLPQDCLFAWCHAHPEKAPAFVARAVPVLVSYEVEKSESSLHPVVRRLLNDFGDREDVQQALWGNIHNFSWWGSTTDYFALHESPLTKLCDEHPRPAVRRWAKSTLRALAESSEALRKHDAEWRARWDI